MWCRYGANRVSPALNRAEHLEERREMMNHWGGYLAALENGQKVVPIHRNKRKAI